MSLYTDKHRLFAAYVKELNSFRPGNEQTEGEAREACDRYISCADCTWKNIFAPDTNELVGFLIFGKSGKEKHPDTDRAIAEAYVTPEYRRQGLAKEICRYLIERAAEKGAEKIYLESSDVAVELYRSLGFEDMNGYMKLNTIK